MHTAMLWLIERDHREQLRNARGRLLQGRARALEVSNSVPYQRRSKPLQPASAELSALLLVLNILARDPKEFLLSTEVYVFALLATSPNTVTCIAARLFASARVC